MPSYVPPEKNVAYVFYVSLVSQADTKVAQANPTLAAGDVQVATDDGAPANLGTLPAVDADFTKRVKVSLSAAEMNGDNVTVIFSDAAGSEWCDLTINIQTVARQLDDLAWPTTAGRSIDVTAGGNVGIDWNNVETPGATVDLSATSINLCDTVTTLTGHTAQTGDSFAYLGTNLGALGANATEAGGTGDQFTAIPWNAAWDAQVESEVDDALATFFTSSAQLVDDIWNEVITGHATADSFGKVFDDQIDGLRTYGDGAWATAVGFSTHSAGDVWAVDATTQQTAGTFGETLGDSAALGTTVHGMVTSILDDTGTSGVAIAAGAITAGSFGAGAIDDAAIAADAFDGAFTRDVDQWEASAPVHSLGTAIMKAVCRVRDNAGTLETYRTNGTTVHMSQTVTEDATLNPVDELTGGV